MNKLTTVQVEIDLGVNPHDGLAMVSSRKLAEVFDKRHDHVMRDIKTIIEGLPKSGERSNEFSRLNFKSSTYKDSQGKKQPEYSLTRDGFTVVAMGFNGKKAMVFKIAYINRFNEMEKQLKNLNIARLEYPELTEAIKSMHAEPKFFHYSNEADMFNQIILGMKSKKFRELHNIEKGESIRPYLTPFQAEAMRKMQQFDVGLVVAVPDFRERKKILAAYFMQTYFSDCVRNKLNEGLNSCLTGSKS